MSRLPRTRLLLLAVTGLLAAPASPVSAANFVLEDWHGSSGLDWQQGSATDFIGWTSASSDGTFDFARTDSAAQRSLVAEAHFLPQQSPGTGEWRFRAPGTSTITKAEYGPASFTKEGCLNEGMRLSNGSWQPTRNARVGGANLVSVHPTACGANATVTGAPVTKDGTTAVTITGAPARQTFCSTASCGLAGSPTSNQAVFGAERIKQGRPGFGVVLPGARLTLTDYDMPKLTGATNSHPRWVRSARGEVKVTSTDTGLGVKSAAVTHAALSGEVTDAQTHSCSGDRTDRCPATWNDARPEWTTTWPYDTDAMPEGVQPYGVAVRDIVENRTPTAGYDTTLVPPSKIDRSVPTDITGYGQVPELDGQWFLGDDTRTLTASAHDTYSGVQSLRVETTEGEVLDSFTFDCANDQCPRDVSETLAVDTTTLPEGNTVVRLRATDLVGNTSVGRTWTLRIDRSTPAVEGVSGQLFDGDDGYTSGREPIGVTVASRDPRSAAGQPLSGIARVIVREVGGAVVAEETPDCSTECPEAPAVNLSADLSALGEGTHSFEAVVTDRVGHEAISAPWSLTIDRSAPILATEIAANATDELSLISWGSVDPDLADGNPGAGTTSEEIRFQEADGSWSTWAPADDSVETERTGHITLQLRLTDRIGNQAETDPIGVDVDNPDISDDEVEEATAEDDECEAIYGDRLCTTDDEPRAGRMALAGRSASVSTRQQANWGVADPDAAFQRGQTDKSFLDSDVMNDLGQPGHLRLLVPWNIMDKAAGLKNRRASLLGTLKKAEDQGIPVMISFEAGCSTDTDAGAADGHAAMACSGNGAMLKTKVPPVNSVNLAAKRILQAVPSAVGENVKWFGIWNEPTNGHQPFNPDNDPAGKRGAGLKRLQRLTLEMTKPRGKDKGVCVRFDWCEIVAAEVELQDPSIKKQLSFPMDYATWLRSISKSGHKYEDYSDGIAYYGAHDYSEVFRTGQRAGASAKNSTLATWMGKLPADSEVWLPEIGAMAETNNLRGSTNGEEVEGAKELENEADYLFKQLSRVKLSNGTAVTAASYYHVCPARLSGFDTGLLGDRNQPGGKPNDCTSGASRRWHVFNLLKSAFSAND